jgi:hypothetical protein
MMLALMYSGSCFPDDIEWFKDTIIVFRRGGGGVVVPCPISRASCLALATCEPYLQSAKFLKKLKN